MHKPGLLEINHPKTDKFDPKTATYIQTVASDPLETQRMDKVKKLYAPDAKPEYKINQSTMPQGMYGYMDFRASVSKCVYQPYNGSPNEYLAVFLEMHDAAHRQKSYEQRMKLYYDRLRELNL